MRLIKITRNGKEFDLVNVNGDAGRKKLHDRIDTLVLDGDKGDSILLTIDPDLP